MTLIEYLSIGTLLKLIVFIPKNNPVKWVFYSHFRSDETEAQRYYMTCQGQQASGGAKIRNQVARAYAFSKNRGKVNFKCRIRLAKAWK